MPTTSSTPITPGSGADIATYVISEDGKPKQLQRTVPNTPDGLPNAYGPGPTTAGTPRATLASDDPAVLVLAAIKAADEMLAPGSGFVVLTSGADLTTPTRAIVITVDGMLSVKLADGTDNSANLIPVKQGQLWPLRAVRLMSGHTAGVIGIK